MQQKQKTIGKLDLVKAVSASTNMSATSVQTVLDSFLQELFDTIASGNRVTIKGLGSFEIRKTKARKGVNPRTLEAIEIPEGHKVVFAPTPALRDGLKENLS